MRPAASLAELEALSQDLHAVHAPRYRALSPDEIAAHIGRKSAAGDSIASYREAQNLEIVHRNARDAQSAFQMRVTRELAEELLPAKVPLEEDVIALNRWHAKAQTLEILFEDTQLPTVLLTSLTLIDLQVIYARHDIEIEIPPVVRDEPTYAITMQAIENDGSFRGLQVPKELEPFIYRVSLGLLLPTSTVSDHLAKFTADPNELKMIGSAPVNEQESALLGAMMALCLKVLLYASTPQAPALEPLARREMGQEGKPGIHGRPADLPVRRIRYLPEVEREKGPATGKGVKHGRVAHFHLLRHERWTNKRGQLIFVSGTPDPKTGEIPRRETVYKVRKP